MIIDLTYNQTKLGVFKLNKLGYTYDLYNLEFEVRNRFEIPEKTYKKIQLDYPEYLDIYILPFILKNGNKFKHIDNIFHRGIANKRYICLDVLTIDTFKILNKIKKMLLNDYEDYKLSNNSNINS